MTPDDADLNRLAHRLVAESLDEAPRIGARHRLHLRLAELTDLALAKALYPDDWRVPMFERFTERARSVVVLAQENARVLNHNYIGTEHLLLGLLHVGEGVAHEALTALNVSRDDVRAEVVRIIGQGERPPSGHIPFTPRAKKVLELGLREALQLGHNYIGTEHLLLALIREDEGVGAQVLTGRGLELNAVRQKVIELLSGYSARRAESKPAAKPLSAVQHRQAAENLLNNYKLPAADLALIHALLAVVAHLLDPPATP